VNEIERFQFEALSRIDKLGNDKSLMEIAHNFQHETGKFDYLYNFQWLGMPIIQYPQDIVALQEIVYSVKPDLIIETGVARGGSLVLSASLLALLDLFERNSGEEVRNRHVIGIDIDIRSHNRVNIENHPLSSYITLIEGSSIDENIVAQVKNLSQLYERVLVLLDSNHTHAHVLNEMNSYSSLVSVGSFLIVYDTVIENSPAGYYVGKPWNKGDNPLTAVREFLTGNSQFVIDKSFPNKLLITVSPDGYLKRIK